MLKQIVVAGMAVYLLGLIAIFSGCASMSDPVPRLAPSSLQPSNSSIRFQDEGSFKRDPKALNSGSSFKTAGSAARSLAPPLTGSSNSGSTSSDTQPKTNQAQVIKSVQITGNRSLAEHEIMKQIRTRPGRYFDPDLLQQDVNELWKMKQIRRVNGPYLDRQADGIAITIDVTERPFISQVKFIGNRGITDRQLSTETNLKNGMPLDPHAVKMAKTRIEDYYEEKGYPKTQVSIVEGDETDDREVVFLIHEDELQRISAVQFEGNQIASNGRLKSFIKMKPGYLWVIGGKVNRRELEQDRLRLESYYRSLGFFNARIGRELIESSSGKWLTVRYTINEGPRYRIRNVSFIGNEQYSLEELQGVVKLRPNGQAQPEFNASKMNRDVTRLEDLYGSQGYVFAKVQAEPRFLEEPGFIDLVYNIEEGKQYRVGEINVVIDGEYGVTKRQVILSRLGLRTGDLIDTRKLRDAEARLGRSRLFTDGSPSAPGPRPRISVNTDSDTKRR